MHVLDEARVAELLAQRGDVHVEGLGGPVPVRIPHLVHDLLAAHDRARVLAEQREQIELLGRQHHLDAVDA